MLGGNLVNVIVDTHVVRDAGVSDRPGCQSDPRQAVVAAKPHHNRKPQDEPSADVSLSDERPTGQAGGRRKPVADRRNLHATGHVDHRYKPRDTGPVRAASHKNSPEAVPGLPTAVVVQP